MGRGKSFGALLIEAVEEAIAYRRGERQARTHMVESQEPPARDPRVSDADAPTYARRSSVPASKPGPSR